MEKYPSISPNAYVGNNPINAVDLEGDSITSQHVEGFFKGVASTGTGLGAIIGQVSSWVGTYNIAKGLINSDNITETMRAQGKAIIADVKNNSETQGEIVGITVTAVASIGVGTTASAGRSGMSVAAKGTNIVGSKFNKVLPTQDWIIPLQVTHYKKAIQAGQEIPIIKVYRLGVRFTLRMGTIDLLHIKN